MQTDPIADMLTRIRNANRIESPAVDMPSTLMKQHLAQVLKDEGFILDYQLGALIGKEQGRPQFQAPAEEKAPKKVLRVYLKYGPNNEAVIRDLKRISRPGCRVYLGKDEIKRVQGGLGISIMTTPKGVMTGRQARRENVGGEILAEVW